MIYIHVLRMLQHTFSSIFYILNIMFKLTGYKNGVIKLKNILKHF